MEQNDHIKKVPWSTFVWATGILLTVIFGTVVWVNAASQTAQDAFNKATEVDVRTIAQFDEILRRLDRIEKNQGAN